MEFGRAQQVGVCVAHLGDADPPRVHLGKQRPALKRIVHNLPLNSHENQSTCESRVAGGMVHGLSERPARNYYSAMAPALSRRTRARDVDRVNTRGLLDAAYADGELEPAEYHQRTAAAGSAKTLAELDALVADLQPSTPVLDTSARLPSKRVRLGAAVGVALVVAGGLVFGLTRSSEPQARDGKQQAHLPTPAPVVPEPAGERVEPVVIAPARPLTQQGLAAMLRQYREHFGDPMARRFTLFPEFATGQRALPGAPAKVQTFDFRSGFTTSESSSSSGRGERDFDSGQINVAVVMGLLADAAKIVAGPPDCVAGHVSIQNNGDPTIGVYVDRRDRASCGHFVADFGGRVIRVWGAS